MKIIKKISIEELPKWSSWPARIFGLKEWKNVQRGVGKVEQEYNKEKYGECLDLYRKATKKPTVSEIKKFEYRDFAGKVCISLGNKLVIVRAEDALKEYYEMILKTLSPLIKDGDAVLELGAGYGYNLELLRKKIKKDVKFYGGEYSENAVTLGNEIFKNDKKPISLEVFNFYDEQYKILEKIDRPVVLFTAHAIEQIPDISNMFKALKKYKNKIKAVVHFEPVYELHDDTLLGMMRKAYANAVDYSRNLMSEIKKDGDIKVLSVKADFLGYNPLNSTSIIKWQYKK
jgi:hypothetical protein